MLQANAVECLVDVRTVPRSRHNLQYNREELSASLVRDHVLYLYMPGLGGFRHPVKGINREPRMAQSKFSRICRLYADTGIHTATGRADCSGSHETDRYYVCGGCTLAMPSLANRRRIASARC